MNEKKSIRLLPLILALLVVVSMARMFGAGKNAITVTDAEMHALFLGEQVKSVTVEDRVVLLKLHKPFAVKGKETETVTHTIYDFEQFYSTYGTLIEEQSQNGIIESYNYHKSSADSFVSNVLPYLIMGVVLFLFWRAMMNRSGNAPMQQFGNAKAKTREDYHVDVSFDDVAGAAEEKEELQEIVGFLREPEKYNALGARIPHGVLLVGPPGTGKTLLAKAVAGEAGCGFLSISGSDFVEMYVGVGASRVRDLFEQAKKLAPAIIFIDEIDAVGRQRGTGLGGGHDEREQTLNQLLVEMDGFGSNQGIVVLAATNRADILDPALLRPGRFDRQIYVGLPDIRGREEILKVHTRKKPLAEDVDLRATARATGGFTGADLENLTNEAALLAARRDEKFITAADMKEAALKVLAGPEKKSRVVLEHEKRLTAFHEAGHAVLMRSLSDHDPVSQITIVPRGSAGGLTVSLPKEDRSYLSKKYMTQEIIALLGGRAAEELVLDDISTGAGNDLQRATAIARRMVTAYGMSERIGTVSYDSGSDEVFIGRSMGHARSYSEATASEIDAEVRRILDDAYVEAKKLLTEHRAALDATAAYLMAHESMEAEDFEKLYTESL